MEFRFKSLYKCIWFLWGIKYFSYIEVMVNKNTLQSFIAKYYINGLNISSVSSSDISSNSYNFISKDSLYNYLKLSKLISDSLALKYIDLGEIESKILEIPQREKAIEQAINNLNSGEILVIAGKGHENIQDYGKSKRFFSDKNIILKSIKKKK